MESAVTLENPLGSEKAIYVARVQRRELNNPYPPRKSGRADPKDYWSGCDISEGLPWGPRHRCGLGGSFCFHLSEHSSHFNSYQTQGYRTEGQIGTPSYSKWQRSLDVYLLILQCEHTVSAFRAWSSHLFQPRLPLEKLKVHTARC